jgi:hypothetical protein
MHWKEYFMGWNYELWMPLEVDGVGSLTVISSDSWSTIISEVERAPVTQIYATKKQKCKLPKSLCICIKLYAIIDWCLVTTLQKEYQEPDLRIKESEKQNQLHVCGNREHK